jgi:hypothetical protein
VVLEIKYWTKRDVEEESRCGLLHLQVGEASPYKSINQIGLTTKNRGKYEQNGVGVRRKMI